MMHVGCDHPKYIQIKNCNRIADERDERFASVSCKIPKPSVIVFDELCFFEIEWMQICDE